MNVWLGLLIIAVAVGFAIVFAGMAAGSDWIVVIGFGICAVVLILMLVILGLDFITRQPDDRTCLHRHLVGKVYACDEWGTVSPTDPRP